MYFMPAGHLNRSAARRVAVAFRLSVEDRDELKRRAAEEGVSVQTYLERTALGRYNAHDRPRGPLYARQKELPIDDNP